MSALSDRMRKRREFRREVAGFTLILRRPSHAEYVALERSQATHLEVAERFVVGWEGVTEADLVVSGGEDEMPFDPEAWRELLADTPALWEVGGIINEAFLEHIKAGEEQAKN
jgi:hypothetical protein